MKNNKPAVGRMARLLLFILIWSFTAGLPLFSGCSTVNKVNPVSDDSVCHWFFGLPHKAVKAALDIDED